MIQRHLTMQEQRTLASFLAGRLPAGQLEAELARARGDTEETPAPLTPPVRVPLPVPAAA